MVWCNDRCSQPKPVNILLFKFSVNKLLWCHNHLGSSLCHLFVFSAMFSTTMSKVKRDFYFERKRENAWSACLSLKRSTLSVGDITLTLWKMVWCKEEFWFSSISELCKTSISTFNRFLWYFLLWIQICASANLSLYYGDEISLSYINNQSVINNWDASNYTHCKMKVFSVLPWFPQCLCTIYHRQ